MNIEVRLLVNGTLVGAKAESFLGTEDKRQGSLPKRWAYRLLDDLLEIAFPNGR